MRQLEPGTIAPDWTARRLAGAYARSATEPLAVFYWTGRVLPGTARTVERLTYHDFAKDSRGNNDPHAVAAELRALAHYLRVHQGRDEVAAWTVWTEARADEYNTVVPWAWRPHPELPALA